MAIQSRLVRCVGLCGWRSGHWRSLWEYDHARGHAGCSHSSDDAALLGKDLVRRVAHGDPRLRLKIGKGLPVRADQRMSLDGEGAEVGSLSVGEHGNGREVTLPFVDRLPRADA